MGSVGDAEETENMVGGQEMECYNKLDSSRENAGCVEWEAGQAIVQNGGQVYGDLAEVCGGMDRFLTLQKEGDFSWPK